MPIILCTSNMAQPLNKLHNLIIFERFKPLGVDREKNKWKSVWE